MGPPAFLITGLFGNRWIALYSATCLKQPLKIDKTKVLKTGGSLLQVESIAEFSAGAFCNTFDLHQAITGLENIYWGLLLSGSFRQVLLNLTQTIKLLSCHILLYRLFSLHVADSSRAVVSY